MLKRAIKSMAESAGILTPSLPDALAAANQHRQAMTAAQAARERAEAALQAGHDAGADEAAIGKLEAALAAAKTAELRAERAYISAEKRLADAQTAEADKAAAAARQSRDAALAAIHKAAGALDRLATEMATQSEIVDKQYAVLNECRRDGVAGVYTPITGERLADFALRHATAAHAGLWTGDKPTAAEAVQRVAGAVKAAA